MIENEKSDSTTGYNRMFTGNVFSDVIFYQPTGDTEKDILTEALPRFSFKGNADIEPKETKPAIDPVLKAKSLV